MNIRRLTHEAGQYGIHGQVINVHIDVQWTVQCVPRSALDDAAIAVHLKCRLVANPVYKSGLVMKSKVRVWLEHLVQTPLYRSYEVKVEWEKLSEDY